MTQVGELKSIFWQIPQYFLIRCAELKIIILFLFVLFCFFFFFVLFCFCFFMILVFDNFQRNPNSTCTKQGDYFLFLLHKILTLNYMWIKEELIESFLGREKSPKLKSWNLSLLVYLFLNNNQLRGENPRIYWTQLVDLDTCFPHEHYSSLVFLIFFNKIN